MTAPVVTAPEAPDGAPVVLHVAGDLSRNRLTTFFRYFMVLPHAIVLGVIGIAVYVVLVISWIAALVTGRNPEGLRSFLVGWLRWSTRVQCYFYLLTDEYPPFGFEAGGYPIDIEVPPAGELNRLAVLFRLVLAIPAFVLSYIAGLILGVLGVVAWLTGVVTGSVPKGIYDTIAGSLQFSLRFVAYYVLITPTYPSGITGPAAIGGPALPA